jgi:hypothetical protein
MIRQGFPDATAWGRAASQGAASVIHGMSHQEQAPGEAPDGSTSLAREIDIRKRLTCVSRRIEDVSCARRGDLTPVIQGDR